MQIRPVQIPCCLPYLSSQDSFDVRDRSLIFIRISRHIQFRGMRITLDLLYVNNDSMSLGEFDKIFTVFMTERRIYSVGKYYA